MSDENDKNNQLVSIVSSDIYEIRGERVILDVRVAEHFGTQTKRINEAVTRNPAKFNVQHTFKLTKDEHEALRSQSATSSRQRGGRRYQPRVYTMKGVARLATVLNTDEALRATDLIIDTFLTVYEQVHQGRKNIAIPHPSQYQPSPKDGQEIRKFKSKLIEALTSMVDTMADIQRNPALRKAGNDLGSQALQNIGERLRTKGLENAKLEAESVLLLAQAEKTLVETRKAQAEIDGINIQNLERSIKLVKELMAMSKELEPAEFVGLLDSFDRDPKLIKAPAKKRKGQKAKRG